MGATPTKGRNYQLWAQTTKGRGAQKLETLTKRTLVETALPDREVTLLGVCVCVCVCVCGCVFLSFFMHMHCLVKRRKPFTESS